MEMPLVCTQSSKYTRKHRRFSRPCIKRPWLFQSQRPTPDPTRGGLATTLNEIAIQSGQGILLDEKAIPLQPAVQAACEMLGFDPLYVANEGKVIVIVPAAEGEAALAAMRQHPYGANAARIGVVQAEAPKRVLMRTLIGGTRILDVLAGEMLPRIC